MPLLRTLELPPAAGPAAAAREGWAGPFIRTGTAGRVGPMVAIWGLPDLQAYQRAEPREGLASFLLPLACPLLVCRATGSLRVCSFHSRGLAHCSHGVRQGELPR